MKMIRRVNPRSIRFVTFISAIGWDWRGRLKVLAMAVSPGCAYLDSSSMRSASELAKFSSSVMSLFVIAKSRL